MSQKLSLMDRFFLRSSVKITGIQRIDINQRVQHMRNFLIQSKLPIKLLRRKTAMNTGASSKRSPVLFFTLVYALSIPFWVLNIIFPIKLPLDNLPVTDIAATFAPTIAALILVYREEKLFGVRKL
ncbi:MAG: hypothetical protein AB7V52_06260, partial [Methanothrix sp.]